MEADGLATAINVMGPKVGYKFALDNGLKVYFIVRNGETFDIFFTPSFKNLIQKGK
jgi:thiamine biosynthesis lipoprotein